MKGDPLKRVAKGGHAALIAPTNNVETMDVEESVGTVSPHAPRVGHAPLHQKEHQVETMTSRTSIPVKWKPERAAPPSFRWRKVDVSMVKTLGPCSSWGSSSWAFPGVEQGPLNNRIG